MYKKFNGGICCALLFLLFSTTSCKKNEDFPGFDLLVDKEWKLTGVIEDGRDVTEPCDVDDVLIFENDKDFSYEFGEICDDAGTIVGTAKTWDMRENYRVVRLKFGFRGEGTVGNGWEYWEITELTETQLILTEDTAEKNNLPVVIRRYEL